MVASNEKNGNDRLRKGSVGGGDPLLDGSSCLRKLPRLKGQK